MTRVMARQQQQQQQQQPFRLVRRLRSRDSEVIVCAVKQKQKKKSSYKNKRNSGINESYDDEDYTREAANVSSMSMDSQGKVADYYDTSSSSSSAAQLSYDSIRRILNAIKKGGVGVVPVSSISKSLSSIAL